MDIRDYRVVFVGRSTCGTKTSLIFRIFNNYLRYEYTSTMGVCFYKEEIELKNGKIIQLSFWDTAG